MINKPDFMPQYPPDDMFHACLNNLRSGFDSLVDSEITNKIFDIVVGFLGGEEATEELSYASELKEELGTIEGLTDIKYEKIIPLISDAVTTCGYTYTAFKITSFFAQRCVSENLLDCELFAALAGAY